MNQQAPTEARIHEWFEELSNWSRWGEDDRLGTLNHITAEKRRAAAQGVEHGTSVSCAWDVRMNSIADGGRMPSQRLMMRTGLGYRLEHEDPESPAGARSSDGVMGTASEMISMFFHGRPITHLDALSHVFWKGVMYGGVPSAFVTDRDGATVHDVVSAGVGIQSRGVLLDLLDICAAADGRPRAIFPADLEEAERRQGVVVETGDILLLRTDEGTRRGTDSWSPAAHGSSGLHAACLPWLHERQVAAIGADGPQEVTPSGYPGITLPVHAVGIVAMGLWLIDNCQLEDLAAACRRYGRWDFFLTVAPLRMEGVTGSPVNPIAVF